MQAIHHRFQYAVSAEKLFAALTLESQIKEWWTDDCSVPAKVGAQAVFNWKNYGWSVTAQIVSGKIGRELVWKCLKSNMQNSGAWVGTEIRFKIIPVSAEQSELEFSQGPYPESACYEVCREGWAFFLGKSLKGYLESGQGSPTRN